MTLTPIIINAPITLGVKGEKGDPGDSFVPDAVGTLAGRATYNGEAAGFSYLANDTDPVPLVYWRLGVSGWSAGVPFVGGSGGTGNVSKVGIPVNDQLAVWTGDGTVEGTSQLTYNGTTFSISGSIAVTGTVDGRDVAADGTKLDGISAGANNYTLPVATTTVIGGVKRNTGTGFVNGIDANGNLTYGTPSGSGDVVGPASSTDSAIALFDGETGKLIKNSIITFSGGGMIPLEMRFPQAVTLMAFGYTGGSVVIDGTGTQLRSPDATDRVTVENGTVTITTNNVTRATITDSGWQLGGSGARVTTILDEDNMASNSATALATQQSIKAYVDALDNRTANRRVAVVGDIVADAPTGYDTIELLTSDNVLVIPTLAGFGDYVLLDSAYWIGTQIINESASTIYLIDTSAVGYAEPVQAGMVATVTDGTVGAWKFSVGHPATTTRTDGNPAIIAPITKSADFTISEAERGAQILLTKTGSGQVITLPNTGISVGWTQTYCRATSQAISFAGAGTLLGSDIASVTENKWFGLSCIATGTYRFV